MKLSDIDIEYLNEARMLIDRDMSKHYTIAEMARHVGLSESKLTRGFKHLFGMGLFEYLGKARLEKGKYMLENTNKTLKEIRITLGYKYGTNFNTAFKKKFGKPPMAWKIDHGK